MLMLWIISIIATLYIADQKKLGMGYFFVSLFIGPLAVIIALLAPSKTVQSSSNFDEVSTLKDAKQQIQDLRYSLYAQEERIKNLEILIDKLSESRSEIPLVNEIKPAAIVVNPVQMPSFVTEEPAAPVKSSDMELDFGRNWLSKIGIAVLALGMAFFISYTFKYFGPFLKIAFVYLVGGALFVTGIKLEKQDKLMNYGRALLGGAWAIIYFTTYAMYHFDASRILPNQETDLFLLAFVVLGMMAHILKYKSEGMMGVALVVGYLTSTIGQITMFTIGSNVFLAVVVLFLVHKFQWVKTLSLGIMLTYGVHFIWVVPNMNATLNNSDWMNLIFLTSYWLVFLIGVHLIRAVKNDTFLERTIAAINLGNIALYSMLSYPLVLTLFYHERFNIVLIEGLVYLAAALMMKKLAQEKMYVSDIVAAVFAITFSISLKFFPTTSLLLWLIEVPFLLFIGTKFKERVFVYFSYALSFFVAFRLMCVGLFDGMPDINVLGFNWTWYGFMCFCAGTSMAGCFYLTQRFKENMQADIDIVFDQIFSFASCAYVSMWLWSLVHQPWIAFVLSMQGWAFVLLSVLMGLRRFRAYAYLVFASSVIIFLAEPIHASLGMLKWFLVSGEMLSIFGAYHAVKYFKQYKPGDLFVEYEEEITFVMGLVLLVVTIHQYVDLQWISLSLGVASVLMILIGFVGGNKTERMGGMALLALTLGRVVVVDLSGLDIIFKIITLIVLGVLFLGVSYVYNRFSIEKK